MDVIRRNTDYALRLVAGLVENYGEKAISARQLAESGDVSTALACKLLQKLSSAKIVKSSMGAGGGFALAKAPEKISLYQIIRAIQGDVCFNQCVSDAKSCPRSPKCAVSKKLASLQKYIEESLKNTTLDKLREKK
ncbi:MAG: Rrf2 family transcriptional regulator [Phycisphaerae bacterium]|nr:Rrf2 family transcriptional regulator [Phycisphaerae bacterium]